MTKAELNKEIERLNDKIGSLFKTIAEYESGENVLVSRWEYENYERIRNDSERLISRCKELEHINNDLVKSISQLNGSSVLKNLSESILKLSNR